MPRGSAPEQSEQIDEPDQPPQDQTPQDRPQARGRWWWALRVLTALAGVAVLTVALVFAVSRLDRSTASPNPRPSPSHTLPGARIPFEFSLSGVTTTSYTGRLSSSKARRAAAEQIRVALSRFYDSTYFDPAEWKAGPSDAAWSMFASNVATRARAADVRSLALGQVSGLTSLEATHVRLNVRLLLDPSLHPLSAVATVSLDATGTLEGGDLLRVSNHASFLFRRVKSEWTVVAYPQTKTTLKEVPAPPPTPVPGPSGSATPSAAPS